MRSLVDTEVPEDDLFAGIDARVGGCGAEPGRPRSLCTVNAVLVDAGPAATGAFRRAGSGRRRPGRARSSARRRRWRLLVVILLGDRAGLPHPVDDQAPQAACPPSFEPPEEPSGRRRPRREGPSRGLDGREDARGGCSAHAQPARRRHLALPAPARRQPGRLVGVVGRGVRRGGPARRAGAALGRLRRLPLVPRHGARVVRGPGDRRAAQRATSWRSRSTARSGRTSTPSTWRPPRP